jgi:hypothetical protein
MGKKQDRVDRRAHNTQKQQNSHGQVSFARPPSLGLKERTRFQPDIPENSHCLKSAMDQKRTSEWANRMSALCQKQTLGVGNLQNIGKSHTPARFVHAL